VDGKKSKTGLIVTYEWGGMVERKNHNPMDYDDSIANNYFLRRRSIKNEIHEKPQDILFYRCFSCLPSVQMSMRVNWN